jgi:hypothetical protein
LWLVPFGIAAVAAAALAVEAARLARHVERLRAAMQRLRTDRAVAEAQRRGGTPGSRARP